MIQTGNEGGHRHQLILQKIHWHRFVIKLTVHRNSTENCSKDFGNFPGKDLRRSSLSMMPMANCFCGTVGRRKAQYLSSVNHSTETIRHGHHFQPGPLSDALVVANLRDAASRVFVKFQVLANY